MLRIVILLLSLSLVFASQSRADDPDTLKVAAPWVISSTDPATDGFIFLRMGVMETLVSTDISGALTEGLSTSSENSANGLSWTFELRDAIFHDVTELSAEVAVIALQRAYRQPGPLSKAPIESH